MKVSAFVLLHKKHSIESVSGNNYRMMKRALFIYCYFNVLPQHQVLKSLKQENPILYGAFVRLLM